MSNQESVIVSQRHKIAIIGSGPMATYTLKNLIKSEKKLDITIFEAEEQMGCGMPYRAGMNAEYMYCNAFSKEIPAITRRLATWLHDLDATVLGQWGLKPADIDARDFYPRVLLGAYMTSEFARLCEAGREAGHTVLALPLHRVSDVLPSARGIDVQVTTPDGQIEFTFHDVVLATGHVWSAAPTIGSANLASPWPYTNITVLPAGKIGILGSSLSAIDVIVALGHEHGTFSEETENVTWFPKVGHEAIAITMVSHLGIMPEPDFFYAYPYEPLSHLTEAAVSAEIAKGSVGLLDRVFALLMAELNHADPHYLTQLGPDAKTIAGFSKAYFAEREKLGGLRALRATLADAVQSVKEKRTQAFRYALLRGHEHFAPVLQHLDDSDWQVFCDELMPVFGDCYAAVPHISVRRVLALFDAGVLDIIPTGEDGNFRTGAAGGVVVDTIDGDIHFDALIDARGQSSAALSDLPFPGLKHELDHQERELKAPFRLGLKQDIESRIYCLAMPQVLRRHPFSQGLANCAELGRLVSQDILTAA